MPCYHPITGYQRNPGEPLQWHNPGDCNEITIPCKQCIGCRLTASRNWATRAMHEAQMHKYNCTITLTYNDEHLPKDLSLDYKHYQTFMRKLRKALNRKHAALQHNWTKKIGNVRFYMGGEYGESYGRPHFHACLFGIDFNDKIYHATTNAGFKIYKSQTLTTLWGKGYASIGALTFESAAYIARYIMKKRTGDGNKTHYEIINLETGEIQLRKKEFNNMSRKPGLGKTWLDKYETDAYPHGKVIIRGHKNNTPKYYDRQWKENNQLAWEDLQYNREMEARAQREHHTDERLAVQEQVTKAKIKSLKRKLT